MDGQSGRTTRPAFAKVTQVKTNNNFSSAIAIKTSIYKHKMDLNCTDARKPDFVEYEQKSADHAV